MQFINGHLSFYLYLFQEDYRKVQTEFKGEKDFFTSENIKACMKKVKILSSTKTANFFYISR